MTCRRGHTEHAKRWVTVNLGGPTGFGDYCAIPERYARSFEMLIYERDETPGPLCPAHDAVSEMIGVHGMWEPQGTTLALAVCESAGPNQYMADFGAHVGWYSLIAASCGLTAMAIDDDAESLQMVDESATANGWGQRINRIQGCHRDHVETTLRHIDADTEPWGNGIAIRLAKIDIEGAEEHAVRMLWPAIEAGLVDHILMEVSPCFGPGYPELVEKLADAGYRVFRLPEKQYPPVELDDPETALAPYRLDLDRDAMAAWIAGCGQADLWLQREGASW